MNVAEVEFKLKDIAEAVYNPGTFIFEFIEAYGAAKPIPRATIAKLKQGSLNKADTKGDLLWPKKLHFRPAAKGQAGPALDALITAPIAKKHSPRFLVTTDGEDLLALDTKLDETLTIKFTSLNERFDFFLPLAGVERYQGVADSPADIKAAGRLAKFYDAILSANPDWTNHQKVHELNLFLTRMLFCMFAQSTQILPKDSFSRTLNDFTTLDGNDVQAVLQAAFDAMNLKGDERQGIPEFAKRFPYVNGGLFRDKTPVPRFDRLARRILIDAAKLNWAEINPDIFGSMIQAVVKPELRGDLGLHYTSVPNIMKVLKPLFLDSLENELVLAAENVRKLEALLTRIRRIRVFDPACGSGNFLIIAYKELCRLERRVFQQLRQHQRQFKLPMSEVQLSSFLGIEIEDFAVETAKLSLYVAQHQMNLEFEKDFMVRPPALPLRDSGRVIHGNATRLDWSVICLPDKDAETYIVGNPPYLGGKKITAEQSEDMEFSGLGKLKQLDYVACWMLKAGRYISEHGGKYSLVATSSICQGEQVHLMWPEIAALGLKIEFIYTPFMWKNSAKLNATVACVIVGISREKDIAKRTIYGPDFQKEAKNINPYMIDFEDLYVKPRSMPLSDVPAMSMGSNPVDGKHLIVEGVDYSRLAKENPEATAFIKPYMGGDEFLYDEKRFCIWIPDHQYTDAVEIPFIRDRVEACRAYRSTAGRDARRASAFPHRFCYSTFQDKPFLIVPNTSGDTRSYIPVGLFDSGTVVNHAAFVVYDAEPLIFSILSSSLHRVWLSAVGGRLEMRYRYSVKLVYNAFPIPALSDNQRSELEECAWSVIEARSSYPEENIAALYDQDMPQDLLDAHRNLDEVIENVYAGRPFSNDMERLEHLFKRYKLMVEKEQAPLLTKRSARSRRAHA
ncbi:class I SAM-dependent DNA methyltransferase [Rhizobium metallidurans]|uniref:site-specific DNA-methyltransferase (adenine-specific) n=1 Tax=Rhizobium metallidurans TaxID=1265931 RepID=A0A7W6CVJ7_9HYPH|nr:class I SAM-dependent DNA methyltransferase [Rhizobium metallidurans]MBB3967201.1 hypothetical protein [Rhizobium metallidurans]